MPFIQKTQWWQNPYDKDERIFVAIVALVILALLVFYNYRYFKELALTTKQPLFLYAFWCGVTLILSPVALVLYVVAWVKFREIQGYDESKPKPKMTTEMLERIEKKRSARMLQIIRIISYMAIFISFIFIISASFYTRIIGSLFLGFSGFYAWFFFLGVIHVLNRATQSRILLRMFVCASLLTFIKFIILQSNISQNLDVRLGLVGYGIDIAFACVILYCYYRIYKELAFITNNKLFYYVLYSEIAFYIFKQFLIFANYVAKNTDFIIEVFAISCRVLAFVVFVLSIIAVARTKEIRKSYSAAS